jgi:hypothetical protein
VSEERNAIHPGIEQCEMPREDKRSNSDEHDAASHFHSMQVASEFAVKKKELIDAKRSQEKRDGQTQ